MAAESAAPDGLTLGQRVADLRRRRGMAQKDLAAEIGRSESWVSQVERDVLPVERMSVLRALAEALGATVGELRPDATAAPVDAAGTDELAQLRLALTGHPALAVLLGSARVEQHDLADLAARVDQAWRLTDASEFSALAELLPTVLAQLERAARQTSGAPRIQAAALLTRAYQATSAAFARQGEADAAWVAADRAARWAEEAGDPLAAVAGSFRMGHAFLTLRRPEQAERVTADAIAALAPLVVQSTCPLPALSLYGAMHLLLAVVAAREGDRVRSRDAITEARRIAARVGSGRNDYDTEFGPTNVELHAVAIAVDLGDAGEAIDLAAGIDAGSLSPERQARLLIDLARAYTQRRHSDQAVATLLAAEEIAPQQVLSHSLVRAVIRDLLSLTGRRATTELVELARRVGVAQ